MGCAALKDVRPLPLVCSWSGGEAAKLLATIQGDEWEEPREFGNIEKASKPELRGEGREGFLEVVGSKLRPKDERSWPGKKVEEGTFQVEISI